MVAFNGAFNAAYYGGAGVASQVSDQYPVVLAGIGFEIDHEDRNRTYDWTHSSIPALRASRDDQTNVGQGTLNPEAFWRRTAESWHTGAGQTHFDRQQEPDVSNPTRFRRSRGVDVWERYEISLLNDTDQKRSVAVGTGQLVTAGTLLYVADGASLFHTDDISPDTPTFTQVTTDPTNDTTSMASDGFVVATAHGSDGVYRADRGATTRVQQITGTVSEVAFGKGRWIAAEGPDLYDVTTEMFDGTPPVALPAAHFTHPNSDWAWNSFAEGPIALYVGGFSGDKSLIYRLTLRDDGAGLNQPVVAGSLPDGEIIQSMQGYLGFVVLGTTKGVRLAIPGSQGELNIGSFIPTDGDVRCFEGQERFIWYGNPDIEGDASGLGRLDLQTFSDPDALAPAFANDIESMVTGDVTACVTFQDRRVFTVDDGVAASIWAEEPGTLVTSGEIDSGIIDYGLTDEKLALFVDLGLTGADGLTGIDLAVDRGPFAVLAATHAHAAGGDVHATGEARGQEFEVRITFARDALDASLGPSMRSWTIRAEPVIEAQREIVVPLRIAPTIQVRGGQVVHCDPFEAVDRITELRDSKQVTAYIEAGRAFSVVIVDYEIRLHHVTVGVGESINGTAIVRLKDVV